MKTTKEIYTVGIHGTTGQQVDEGWLDEATMVKNIRKAGENPVTGETKYRFEASTDEGKTWYTQETYEMPS